MTTPGWVGQLRPWTRRVELGRAPYAPTARGRAEYPRPDGCQAGDGPTTPRAYLSSENAGNRHGGVGAIFIVVVVDVARADRSVSVRTPARITSAPIHSASSPRRSIRRRAARICACRCQPRGHAWLAEIGPRTRTVVIGRARRYIDGNHSSGARASRRLEHITVSISSPVRGPREPMRIPSIHRRAPQV